MHKPISLHLPALLPDKEALFISDLHFGCDTLEAEQAREDRWLQFLKARQARLQYLFCLGDIFHIWYVGKMTLRKGFVRFQAYLSSLVEEGIPVYFLLGNHEFRKDHIRSGCQLLSEHYLHQELGVIVYDGALCPTIGQTRLYLAHGDVLTFGWIKKFILLPLLHGFISIIHPDITLFFAEKYGKYKKKIATLIGSDEDRTKDPFLSLLRDLIKKTPSSPYHYYVLGHSHVSNHVQLSPDSQYINLGADLRNPTYGCLNSKGDFTLHTDRSFDD